MLIFVSTCKQITQSEPSEFSKNGVFHSKAEVINLLKCLNLYPDPTLILVCACNDVNATFDTATLTHFTPLLQKISRYQIPENFLLTEILDIKCHV